MHITAVCVGVRRRNPQQATIITIVIITPYCLLFECPRRLLVVHVLLALLFWKVFRFHLLLHAAAGSHAHVHAHTPRFACHVIDTDTLRFVRHTGVGSVLASFQSIHFLNTVLTSTSTTSKYIRACQ